MNTTARIEVRVNQNISIYLYDAQKLIAGKTNWLKKRDEVVYAKGKGEMETYCWCCVHTLVVRLDLVVPTRATILGKLV
jgi:hypothetical protein